MRKMFVTATLLGALAWPAVAMAAPGHGHRGHGDHSYAQQMFDHLNLTADQKAKLKAIRQKYMEAAKADRQALKAKRKQLAELMRSQTANKDQALGLQREIGALHERLAENRLAGWFEVRAVLTADQLKKLGEMGPRRHGKDKNKHGHE